MSEEQSDSQNKTTATVASENVGNARRFWNSGRHTHVISLLLMAVATLGSAWSGFQASLWNGIQTFRLADATKLGGLATEERVVANQHRNLDAAVFIEYCRAVSEG